MSRLPPPKPLPLWAATPPIDPNVRQQDAQALTGQNAAILAMLARGWVTQTDAYKVGCSRLAATVLDIRAAGHNVVDEYVPGSRLKRYRLGVK